MTGLGFDISGQVRRPRQNAFSQFGLYAVMATFTVAIGLVMVFATSALTQP